MPVLRLRACGLAIMFQRLGAFLRTLGLVRQWTVQGRLQQDNVALGNKVVVPCEGRE